MEKHTEEVDLFYVVKKLKNVYLGWLARGYHAVQFLKKYWIALAIMIVGGHFGGKFWQQSQRPKRQAVMIVQNNFGSSSYVYDAVEILNIKCKQIDEQFLKEVGLNTETPEILEIVIEPVVSVNDLLKVSEPNDRNIDTYISRIETEEDLMVSEIFYPQYHYHKITVTTNTPNAKVLDKILAYLNSNDNFNTIKEVVVAETDLRIERNNKTIELIDALFAEYSGKNEAEAIVSNDLNIPTIRINNTNLHQLVEKKTELIEENKELMAERTKYGSVVAVVNSPRLVMTSDFFDKKSTLIPVGLVVVFFGFFWLKGLYLKGKKHASAA